MATPILPEIPAGFVKAMRQRIERRVLVTGGRGFADEEARLVVEGALDRIHETVGGMMTVIHGGARGADTLAGEWAKKKGVPVVVYEANWTLHGKSAGPRRNQRMIDEGKPHFLVAFPGGKGTEDMVQRCGRASIGALFFEPMKPS